MYVIACILNNNLDIQTNTTTGTDIDPDINTSIHINAQHIFKY